MKKIYCSLAPNDFLKVTTDDDDGFIRINSNGVMCDVMLSPDKIRKLRKQLKKALREIEGMDQQEDEA